MENQQAVMINYSDIIAKKDLNNEILNAFGDEGLGLILIKGYPNLQKKREKVL